MDRTATPTILGFNYQFNKSIIEILNSDDQTKIMLEGSNEDLDIFTNDKNIAIQCKYYESSENLTPSVLAKPILDMLLSYIKNEEINFRLYIHHKNIENEQKENIDIELFNKIISTNNKSYIKKYFPKLYNFEDNISKLFNKKELNKNDIIVIHKYISEKGNAVFKIDVNDFINKIEIISAPSYENLENKIIKKIVDDGYNEEDAINLFYPNFFHKVATISANPKKDERIIKCSEFKSEVYNLKELLSTKWLSVLYSKDKYKKSIKNNLKIRLQNNSSNRVIYLDVRKYSNQDVASFIVDYVGKYNKKPKLNKIPFFIIVDDNYNNCSEIQSILYENYKISFENGDVARKFNLNKFIKADNCSLKICLRCEDIDNYLQMNLPNDLFVIGDVDVKELENAGVTSCKIQELSITDLKEVFYLGGKR